MLRLAFAAIAALLCSASALHAQDPGPQAPPPTFKVERIPAEPHPGPPPLPVEEIIRKCAANEDVMKKAYDSYDFTQSIRLDELTDPGGKFSVTGEVYTKPDGLRYMRVTKPAESSLKLMHFSLEDVRVIAAMPEFPLTAEEIENYNFKYAGQEKLDQLNTYIFQVKPKLLSRKKRYFEGVIWIDDHDFAIVKSYVKSEGNEDVPLRLVVRSTDFKLRTVAAASSDGPATPPPAADSSGSSSSVPLTPPPR
jgi:hypothetical protein